MSRAQRKSMPPMEEIYTDAVISGAFGDTGEAEIIATNRVVLLTCTLAALLPLFALFLIFAEKQSRAIRHFSLQSVALSAGHVLFAILLVAVNAVFSAVPFFGFLINLTLWIVYFAVLILMLILRVRMMLFAWRGAEFMLPLGGRWVTRFI